MEMTVEIEDRLLVRAMEITGITNRAALITKVVEESIAIYKHRAQRQRENPMIGAWGKDDPRWD
jgi:CRISPR/Cas system-associated endoribonuclease Cas2